jgi:hypothetical protein
MDPWRAANRWLEHELGLQPLRHPAPKLVYHGDPVEHTNKNYAIYWIPTGYSVSANDKTLIDRFFTDVAKVSGVTTNVYYDATEYHDTTCAA